MESLVRYAFFNLTLKVLFLEFIIISFLILGIVFLKIFYQYKGRREKRIKDDISKRINEALLQNVSCEVKLPRQLRNFRILTQILDNFNHRITDPIWQGIKENIIDGYLFKMAKQNMKSFFWRKRQLAANCFLLCPAKAKKEDIFLLLQDPKFLIRIPAAFCATRMPYRDLFYEVIKKMSEEKSLARFSYRDALLQSDAEKYQWIEDLLKTKPNFAVAAICLDLLSERVIHHLFPVIIPYIYKEDYECKILAVKALKNYSSEESIEVLMNCLQNQTWEIRSESLKILSSLYAKKAIPKVEVLLNDPIWFVRLQAALALKNLGSEGLKILSNQNTATQPLAYEISEYVMSL